MSKIVFFDIDGTILDHNKNLPVSTKKAIAELKEKGTFVAIATGRAPFMFKDLREELGIESYVSFNGQHVVFEGEVIYQNPLDTNELAKLSTHCYENGHPLVFMSEHTMKASVHHDEYIMDSMGSLRFSHPEVDADFFRDRTILQTLLFCEEKDEQEYLQEYPGFRLIRWHPFSTDILPAGGSKAEGIKKMIERLGFKLEDVYAFGDGLNDIEMLQTVGTGVAMGNASDVLKGNADHITDDVCNEGIWKGLKALKLI